MPAFMKRIFWPFLSAPSITRTRMMTPRYVSYQLSTSSAFSGAWISPFGCGTRVTMASSRSGIPSPVLAETRSASVVSMPIMSSICLATASGSAAGRSILFSTGTISLWLSIAWYTFASVCASTPWLASTTSSDPSQAARQRLTS